MSAEVTAAGHAASAGERDPAAEEAVRTAARAARAAVPGLASAPDAQIDEALRAMAAALDAAAPAILEANSGDMRAAAEAGLPGAMQDRLKLDSGRLAAMASQLEILAGVPHEPLTRKVRDLPGGSAGRGPGGAASGAGPSAWSAPTSRPGPT